MVDAQEPSARTGNELWLKSCGPRGPHCILGNYWTKRNDPCHSQENRNMSKIHLQRKKKKNLADKSYICICTSTGLHTSFPGQISSVYLVEQTTTTSSTKVKAWPIQKRAALFSIMQTDKQQLRHLNMQGRRRGRDSMVAVVKRNSGRWRSAPPNGLLCRGSASLRQMPPRDPAFRLMTIFQPRNNNTDIIS